MYWSWSSQAPPANFDSFGVSDSNSWEKELQDYGWTSIVLDMATFNTGIGHAAQMAWANTNLIGCGVKYCGKDSNGWHRVTVVCQYKSQGNIINTNIYQKGNSCSACTSGSTCETSTGLCV
ncbi:hypothetical protein L3Y34_006955 [Caenorhabditis briggsae]|uniref:SCP domain-containing protein n=1 Tax=Caenorhabditis briggsae TaxID=6238 RepID=A0AAE9A5I8_CAEBR|nr:hypothetical protein L3Y34_006955 [Caenorhabditis briggsae]